MAIINYIFSCCIQLKILQPISLYLLQNTFPIFQGSFQAIINSLFCISIQLLSSFILSSQPPGGHKKNPHAINGTGIVIVSCKPFSCYWLTPSTNFVKNDRIMAAHSARVAFPRGSRRSPFPLITPFATAHRSCFVAQELI